MLVDQTQYAIGLRQDVTIQRSIHNAWLNDAIDWRLILRVTGEPLWNEVITPRNGTSSLGWCIVLDDRA